MCRYSRRAVETSSPQHVLMTFSAFMILDATHHLLLVSSFVIEFYDVNLYINHSIFHQCRYFKQRFNQGRFIPPCFRPSIRCSFQWPELEASNCLIFEPILSSNNTFCYFITISINERFFLIADSFIYLSAITLHLRSSLDSIPKDPVFSARKKAVLLSFAMSRAAPSENNQRNVRCN